MKRFRSGGPDEDTRREVRQASNPSPKTVVKVYRIQRSGLRTTQVVHQKPIVWM